MRAIRRNALLQRLSHVTNTLTSHIHQALVGQSLAGLLRLTPLDGAAGRIGWADAPLLPHPAPGAGGGGGWLQAAAVRGIYRQGVAGDDARGVSNDASADPAGYPGDGFACTCADDTAAAASVSAAAGLLAQAGGAHVRDSVRCEWAFGSPLWAAVRFRPAAAAAAGLDPTGERLRVASSGPPGDCYPLPCDLAALAAAASVTASVPALVVYEATTAAARRLRPRPPGGGSGGYTVAFERITGPWPGPSRRAALPPLLAEQANRSELAPFAGGGSGDGGGGGGGGRGGRRVGELGNDTALVLSLSGEAGVGAPCSFRPADGRAVLHLLPGRPATTALEGVWAGATGAETARGGMGLFELGGAGRCGGAARRQAAASGTEACATLCVSDPGCAFYSYAAPAAAATSSATAAAAAAGDCLLHSAPCALVDGSGYATFRRRIRTELVNATCGAALAVRGRAVRLHVHSCAAADGYTAVAAQVAEGIRRRSPQAGLLHGLLERVADGGAACDLLTAAAAMEAEAAAGGAGGAAKPPCAVAGVGYWLSRVRWTGSARDRAVGDADSLLVVAPAIAGGGSGGNGGADELILFMFPSTAGPMPSPATAMLGTLHASAQRFALRRTVLTAAAIAPVATAPTAEGQADENLELGCLAATAAVAALAGESDSCARAVAAAFPDIAAATAAGVKLKATVVLELAVCRGQCFGRAAAAVSAAARNCSAAWAAQSLAAERTRAGSDGVPVLGGGGGVEVGRFGRLLALADARLRMSTACVTNRDGQVLAIPPNAEGGASWN